MEFVVPGAASLGLFIGAALVLLVVPGPAVLYIFARSVEQGPTAGLVSILGIHTATLVHVAAATLGLSAILASSALAFSIVKYAGAAYLIWMGLRKIFGPTDPLQTDGIKPAVSHLKLFREGFVVNLLNPKTALFFLAFLPQFVQVELGGVAMQIAFLGLLFTVFGIVTDSCYALAAGALGGWLKRTPVYFKAERWVTGIVFIGLGITAALAGNHKK